MKLCLIYNFAQHYRASIFKLIDHSFDCDFLFGDAMGDVKKMDYSCLRGKVIETHSRYFFGGWKWQPGVVAMLRKPYTHYILLGETRALSTWLFCILSRLFYRKKKLFFWTHGWYGKESWLESVIKKWMFRLANGGIFLYGNYARELMIKQGFHPNRLYTIHNSLAYDYQKEIRAGLHTEPIFKSHFANSYNNLIFVGRLTPVKKLDQIFEAMAICKNKGNNYNLVLIGSGEKEDELKTLVKSLALEKNVWFYGPCYDEHVLGSLIYNADLCVAPGNIGLTAMHSMVFGTPCITHNDFKWQMPEFEAIKDGVTGTFFTKDDVDSLAKTIDQWFKGHNADRERVRCNCMTEIDTQWTPQFQLEVIKKAFDNCK